MMREAGVQIGNSGLMGNKLDRLRGGISCECPAPVVFSNIVTIYRRERVQRGALSGSGCQRLCAWRPQSLRWAESYRANREHPIRSVRQEREHFSRVSEDARLHLHGPWWNLHKGMGRPDRAYDKAADRWLLDSDKRR